MCNSTPYQLFMCIINTMYVPHIGNTNLIYSIIRSKAVFYQLANLPEDSYQLVKSRSKPVAGAKEEEEEGIFPATQGTSTGTREGRGHTGDINRY